MYTFKASKQRLGNGMKYIYRGTVSREVDVKVNSEATTLGLCVTNIAQQSHLVKCYPIFWRSTTFLVYKTHDRYRKYNIVKVDLC